MFNKSKSIKIVSLFLVIISLCGIISINAAAYSTGTYRVNTSSGVNVRSGAGTGYSIVGAASNGISFNVSRISGSWGYTSSIRCTNGTRSGWVCLNYCQQTNSSSSNSGGERSTYFGVFASPKGYGYDFFQASAAQSLSFTKGSSVYVWGWIADANKNLYKTYGRKTLNMTLAFYRPNGSCAFSYTYNNCDCNWIRQTLNVAGNWKIQCQITGDACATTTRTITVTNPAPATVYPSSVSLNYKSISLNNGNVKTLSATVYPSNATNKYVSWTSSNPNVAYVSNGKVTACSPGTAVITAKTCNGKTASCTITVKGIAFGKFNTYTIYVGDKYSINTTSCGVSSSKSWSSSNSSVLSVNSSGQITAKRAGTARISVRTSDGYTDVRTYTVLGKTTTSRKVEFNNTNDYITVRINAGAKAGNVKINTFALGGLKTNAKIHVTLRDNKGNWIWEGDTNSGKTLTLGSDHTYYRIYVRPASYPNTIIGNSQSFDNAGKCHTWSVSCSSNSHIS